MLQSKPRKHSTQPGMNASSCRSQFRPAIVSPWPRCVGQQLKPAFRVLSNRSPGHSFQVTTQPCIEAPLAEFPNCIHLSLANRAFLFPFRQAIDCLTIRIAQHRHRQLGASRRFATPHRQDAEVLLRLLRCLPHARLHERAQSPQQRPQPPAQRRRLLSANRPRKSPIRHRLHHLLLRRRGPSPRQPHAPAQPARRRQLWPRPRSRPRHAPASAPRPPVPPGRRRARHAGRPASAVSHPRGRVSWRGWCWCSRRDAAAVSDPGYAAFPSTRWRRARRGGCGWWTGPAVPASLPTLWRRCAGCTWWCWCWRAAVPDATFPAGRCGRERRCAAAVCVPAAWRAGRVAVPASGGGGRVSAAFSASAWAGWGEVMIAVACV